MSPCLQKRVIASNEVICLAFTMPLYHEVEHGPFHIRIFRNVDKEIDQVTVSLRKQWTVSHIGQSNVVSTRPVA